MWIVFVYVGKISLWNLVFKKLVIKYLLMDILLFWEKKMINFLLVIIILYINIRLWKFVVGEEIVFFLKLMLNVKFLKDFIF